MILQINKNIKKGAEEWMGQLRIKANECNYQKCDRQLKEQLINGINDKGMTSEIIKEIIAFENTSYEQVLSWAGRVEV